MSSLSRNYPEFVSFEKTKIAYEWEKEKKMTFDARGNFCVGNFKTKMSTFGVVRGVQSKHF